MWKGIANDARKQIQKEQDQKYEGRPEQLKFYPGYKSRSERLNSKPK